MDLGKWLGKHKVSAGSYNADELLDSFLVEMGRGLNGEESSLAMIPAYVNAGGTVPVNESVAVIDAGGTNLRICLVHFDGNGQAHLSNFSKQAMPGRDREQTASEFYKVLSDALEPMKDEFHYIGFCFSYAVEILPNYRGRLLHWTKEVKIPDLVGTCVGTGLIETLEARGICDKEVVLLNDTVAALLAGVSKGQAFNASSYVGFILGTGTNSAYIEQNCNIAKLTDPQPDGAQAINVESGAFAVFERGSIDIRVDAESDNPDGHVFEKLISGVYMGVLSLELMKELAGEGAFSGSAAALLAKQEELSVIHIDNLAADNGRDIGIFGDDAFTAADRETATTVFRAVVDRAALFTAVNIAAAVVKSGGGTDPEAPVCVNIDGSTYYKTDRLAEKAQAYLKRLMSDRGLHIRCIHVEDAPVVGAAIAGLTTFS